MDHPVSDPGVQKHSLLVEQGVSEDGDDPPKALVGLVFQSCNLLLPPSVAVGESRDEVDGVVHGEEESHQRSLPQFISVNY